MMFLEFGSRLLTWSRDRLRMAVEGSLVLEVKHRRTHHPTIAPYKVDGVVPMVHAPLLCSCVLYPQHMTA